MAPKASKFGQLVVDDPDQARKDLTLAFYRAGGIVTDTAEALELSISSYHRLKKALGIPKIPPIPEFPAVDPGTELVVAAAKALMGAEGDDFDEAWEDLEDALAALG